MTDEKQIKSRQRVSDHGEVYTPSWIVQEMLNLIPTNSKKVESRYLETSAGEGAFILAILIQKMELIFSTYSSIKDREFYTLIALSNIYGLELLKDNVEVIKFKMRLVIENYFSIYEQEVKNPVFFEISEKIININIININALNFRVPVSDSNNCLIKDERNEIVYSSEHAKISEWIIDYKEFSLQQIDYYYKDVVLEQQQRHALEEKQREESKEMIEQLSFFSLEDDNFEQLELFDVDDVDTYVSKAKPIHVHVPIKYLR